MIVRIPLGLGNGWVPLCRRPQRCRWCNPLPPKWLSWWKYQQTCQCCAQPTWPEKYELKKVSTTTKHKTGQIYLLFLVPFAPHIFPGGPKSNSQDEKVEYYHWDYSSYVYHCEGLCWTVVAFVICGETKKTLCSNATDNFSWLIQIQIHLSKSALYDLPEHPLVFRSIGFLAASRHYSVYLLLMTFSAKTSNRIWKIH